MHFAANYNPAKKLTNWQKFMFCTIHHEIDVKGVGCKNARVSAWGGTESCDGDWVYGKTVLSWNDMKATQGT